MKTISVTTSRGVVAAALVAGACSLAFLPAAAADDGAGHIMTTPEDLGWSPGPGSLPPGAEVVLIQGDPAEVGPLALRLRFPAGYRIPAHAHPQIEHITVLSGVFNIGMGEVLDEATGHAMPAGSFVVMPPGQTHFAWTEEETVVQLHSIGPWGITYVDPTDDPRGSN
jgi:quercetin dioxygenase-like cupin family protein